MRSLCLRARVLKKAREYRAGLYIEMKLGSSNIEVYEIFVAELVL